MPRKQLISAGIVPVRREGDRWLFLVLRVYNYWDFPKGLVEPGEDAWSAALRELREETGITGADPKWGRDFHETAPYSNNKIARYFLAEVGTSDVKTSWEHHEHRWVSHEEARPLLVPRVAQVLEWALSLMPRE